MNQEQPRNKMRMRSVNISKAISVLVALLVLRLFWVQVIEGSRYEEMAMNQTEGSQTLYSPRGTIYDRNGKEMAFSIMVKSLYGDPGMLNVSPKEAAKALAPILHKRERHRGTTLARYELRMARAHDGSGRLGQGKESHQGKEMGRPQFRG